MSLEETLSKMMQGDDPTAVDVAMALLDDQKTAMTSNIPNVRVMNALKIYEAHYNDPENKAYSPKSALVMRTLYDAILLHNISKKGWRAEQIVKMFNGLQIFLGMGTNPQQEQQRGSGLMGRRR